MTKKIVSKTAIDGFIKKSFSKSPALSPDDMRVYGRAMLDYKLALGNDDQQQNQNTFFYDLILSGLQAGQLPLAACYLFIGSINAKDKFYRELFNALNRIMENEPLLIDDFNFLLATNDQYHAVTVQEDYYPKREELAIFEKHLTKIRRYYKNANVYEFFVGDGKKTAQYLTLLGEKNWPRHLVLCDMPGVAEVAKIALVNIGFPEDRIAIVTGDVSSSEFQEKFRAVHQAMPPTGKPDRIVSFGATINNLPQGIIDGRRHDSIVGFFQFLTSVFEHSEQGATTLHSIDNTIDKEIILKAYGKAFMHWLFYNLSMGLYGLFPERQVNKILKSLDVSVEVVPAEGEASGEAVGMDIKTKFIFRHPLKITFGKKVFEIKKILTDTIRKLSHNKTEEYFLAAKQEVLNRYAKSKGRGPDMALWRSRIKPLTSAVKPPAP